MWTATETTTWAPPTTASTTMWTMTTTETTWAPPTTASTTMWTMTTIETTWAPPTTVPTTMWTTTTETTWDPPTTVSTTLWTPTTGNTTTRPGTRPYFTATGPCMVDNEGCATSGNWPGNYGNQENCVLTPVRNSGTGIAVRAFNTERRYDRLTVNGRAYSGGTPPADGTVLNGDVTWLSDFSVTTAGWKICFQSDTPPTDSTTMWTMTTTETTWAPPTTASTTMWTMTTTETTWDPPTTVSTTLWTPTTGNTR